MFGTMDALLQFRLPVGWLLPGYVRDLGTESSAERSARIKRNERSGAMESLLNRNGASLAKTRERIAAVGFKLVDAYAQRRVTPTTDWLAERSYLLLTFVFRPAGYEKPVAQPLFDWMAEQRWESVSVSANRNSEHAVLCVRAATLAQAAKMLEVVDDPEAAPYGIVVLKAVRKKDRAQGNKTMVHHRPR